MEELLLLLENFWILREKDKEEYHKLRDGQARLKLFLEEKLGYKLISNTHMVKLEKVPGEAQAWMGIEEFNTSMDYVLLCLVLAFLEDKGLEEQFVLSNFTEYIQTAYPGNEKVDWTLFSHRKALVRVLNFAVNMGIIRVNDGEQERFSQERNAEVVYENPGTSGYFMRSLSRKLDESPKARDLLQEEWTEGDLARGSIRRYRVYRKLVLSPVVYSGGPEDQDFLYIKNYRNTLQRDFEEYLRARLHVHKTCAFLIYPERFLLKSFFPNNKNVSDIILQLAALLREKVNKGEVSVNIDDTILLSEVDFHRLISDTRKRFKAGWYKSYRELSPSKLAEEITNTMITWKMLEYDEEYRAYSILPFVGKFAGSYPENFEKGAQK